MFEIEKKPTHIILAFALSSGRSVKDAVELDLPDLVEMHLVHRELAFVLLARHRTPVVHDGLHVHRHERVEGGVELLAALRLCERADAALRP